MNSLYNLLLRQSTSLQTDLNRLEASYLRTSTLPSPSSLSSLTSSLSTFSRTISDYSSLAQRELNSVKASKAVARAEKFRDQESDLQRGLQDLRQGRLDQVRDRISNREKDGKGDESASSSSTSAYSVNTSTLNNNNSGRSTSSHNHNHSPSSTVTAESPFSTIHARTSHYPSSNTLNHNRDDPLSAYRMNDSAVAMFGGASNGSGREGSALREHSFINNTEAQLDAYISQGREIWENLSQQREILKGTRRKLLDAANTLGLSRDVIGYIERRSTQDNIILVVGALFTLVCFWYIYKWFG